MIQRLLCFFHLHRFILVRSNRRICQGCFCAQRYDYEAEQWVSE